MRRVSSAVLIVGLVILANVAWAADKQDESVASLGLGQPPGSSEAVAFYNVAVDDTGAAYPWIDATVGTELVAAEGDDAIGQLTFPFPFQVYDNMYDSPDVIDVNSNGSVHFDQGGPRTLWPNCGDVPSTIDGQWVAVLGDDLISNSIWYLVTGTAPNRVLTIEWQDVTEFGGTGLVDLQVNLFEGGNDIVTQVRIVTPPEFVSDGLGGINAGDGIDGTEVFCASAGGTPSAEFDIEYAWFVPVELQSISVE